MRVGGPTPLVSSKVNPPAVVEAHVRPHVLEKIAEAARKRLLVVRAPAGYGKTTVVRFAAERLSWRIAWYRLDALDHDPMTFVHGITESVRRAEPGFGDVVIARLAEAREVPIDLARAVALLVKAFEDEVVGEIHLVVDDYHEAASSSELNETLRVLLMNSPSHVHFILLSRYRPTIGITRLLLRGEASELFYDDLRLDSNGIRGLLAANGVTGVSDSEAEHLLDMTEGWAASVVLAAQSGVLGESSTLRSTLSRPRLGSGVFSFFAEEAFLGMDHELADFLLKTCCFDSMSPALAAKVAENTDAERLLHRLAATNTFTFHDAAQDTYRYHHLFRDFLRQRFIRDCGTAAFRTLQSTTAAALEREGDPEAAIELMFAANEPEAALEILGRCGDLVTETARLDTLRSWLSRTPQELRARNPWAMFLEGWILRREGRVTAAVELLEGALSSTSLPARSRTRYHFHSALEEVHFWKGLFDKAAAHCRRALTYAETPRDRVHSRISLGSALRYLGDASGSCREWDSAAKEIRDANSRESIRLKSLKAAAQFIEGSFETAHSEITRVRAEIVQSRALDLTIPFIGLVGEVALETGRLGECESSLQECADTCCRYAIDPLPDVLAVEARHASASGNLQGAEHALESLLGRPGVQESVWTQAFTWDNLGIVRRYRGDLAGALAAHRSADQVVREMPSGYLRTAITVNLVCVRLLAGEESSSNAVRLVAREADLCGYGYLAMRARTLGQIATARQLEPVAISPDLVVSFGRHAEMGHVAFLGMEIATQPNLGRDVLDAGVGRVDLARMCAKLFRLPIAAKAIATAMPEKQEAALAVVKAANDMDDVEARAAILEAARRHRSLAVRRLARMGAPDPASGDSRVVLGLTRREMQVLRLIADGQRNHEIAESLFLSEKTVKTHVNRIFTKLAARDRVHAVLLYNESVARADDESDADSG